MVEDARMFGRQGEDRWFGEEVGCWGLWLEMRGWVVVGAQMLGKWGKDRGFGVGVGGWVWWLGVWGMGKVHAAKRLHTDGL